jgi:hypothetical protein
MNNAKLQILVDRLIDEYNEKKINATDLNSVRKALDTKIKAGVSQIKYNQYLNSKSKIDFFEDGN